MTLPFNRRRRQGARTGSAQGDVFFSIIQRQVYTGQVHYRLLIIKVSSLSVQCLSMPRAQTFDRLNVPPQQRDLFTALSHALEHAREEHETEMRKSSCTRVQCQLGLILAEDCSGVMKVNQFREPLASSIWDSQWRRWVV